jgi:hypothetical protein
MANANSIVPDPDARYLNGRLALNWLGRRMKSRWRMVLLDGQWYDRTGIRAWIKARLDRGLGAFVPHSKKPLTKADMFAIYDPNPYRPF